MEIKMKLSNLQDLFYAYNGAKYAPSLSEIHFGCDCGCGGDSYTTESWDEAEASAAKAIADMKEFCTKFGIYYDGIYEDESNDS